MTTESQPSFWNVVGVLATQSALLTALMYYLGWARTNALFGYFGIDEATLGFSTSEYLLRAINPSTRPLMLVALLGLGALAVHHAVRTHAARRGPRLVRRIEWCVRLLGVGAAVVALAGLLVASVGSFLGQGLPALLLMTSAALAYAGQLGRLSAGGTTDANISTSLYVRSFALLTLAGLGALWLVAVNAERGGENDARALSMRPHLRPEIVVYSKHRLAISGPKVVVRDIKQPDSEFKFIYTGLHLLIQRRGECILLPSVWNRGVDPVFRLTMNDGVRIDVKAVPH